jgi:dethiobiotin synthetase
MKGFFITGTDTSVGKTVVTAGLLYWLRKNNINAIPMKPVQTGTRESKGKLYSQDLAFSLKSCDLKLTSEEIRLLSPFCYKTACSPRLAGKMAGKYPDINTIIKNLKTVNGRYDYVLVEGAGGIMVPLNRTKTMLDLMKEINFPIILVIRSTLGTINHTLLSINMLRASGLEIAGVVVNDTAPENKKDYFIKEDNISTISKLGRVKVLAVVNYIPQMQRNKKKFLQNFENCLREPAILLSIM